jgi:tetratricopeptide (TPR) repeat protein
MIAAVRALMAPLRAARSARIDSTMPSRRLAGAVAVPANTYRRAGDPARAVEDQHHAIMIFHETEDQSAEARALWRLGLVSRDLDQAQRARDHWQHALTIFDELGAPQAEQVRRLLDAPTGEESIGSGHD